MCGANGFNNCKNVLYSALFIFLCFVNSFTIVINVDTDVLNFISSISFVIFFTALCIIDSNSFEYSSSSVIISCKLHTRSKNLLHPRILSIDHGAVWSNGPINISYTLKLSAPKSLTISSGFTTFPFDLDIFSPLLPNIIPCDVRF